MKVEKSNIPTTSWEQKPGDTINCNDPIGKAVEGDQFIQAPPLGQNPTFSSN